MQLKNVRFAFAAVVLVMASCQQQLVESVDTLTRNTDKISLAYNLSSATFTVRSVSPWTVRSDADWLTLDPVEGPGSTVDYITVTATAEPNTGEARSAIIYLESAPGLCLEITATQASGVFEIGKPIFSGSFRLGSSPNATIDVPYSKAQGKEEILIKATLSGEGAEGITFKDYTAVVPASGDGFVSATFDGIPAKMGDLEINAEIIYDGKTQSSGLFTSTVLGEKTLLLLPASKFPWGGHYFENKPGIRSVLGENAAAKVTDETSECKYSEPGTTDLFRSEMEEFKLARGLKGYEGSKVYEHGGMIKIGTSKVGGFFTTPALDGLSGDSDISVEFDFGRWSGDEGEVSINALNGGELAGGVLPTTSGTLMHFNYTIYGATPSTRISWSAGDLTVPGSRFFIGNVVISIADQRKEPLTAPEGLSATAFEDAIELKWNAITGATGYEAYLAPASDPEFRKTIVTDDTSAKFTGLKSNTEYIACVKAVYGKDRQFDSEESLPFTAKTLFVLPKLSAPVAKIYKSERAMVIIEWTTDMNELSSRKFTTELRASDGTVIRTCTGDYSQVAGLEYNRFVFCGLSAKTAYKLAVKRVTTDATKYSDSEWTVIDYTSMSDVNVADYVFYEDFNDLWIGANNNNLAWGPNTSWSSNYPVANYISKVASEKECTTACRPESTCANAWASAFKSYVYHDDYWGKWNFGNAFTAAEVNSENAIQIMLYPGSGCIKYGSGSSNGAIVLPALKSLTQPTDVVVSFDMIPYATLNTTDGELVQISECLTCSGKIYSGSGEITDATNGVIVFDVKSPKELGAWKDQTFSFTVKGATADTRIVIASGNTGAKISAKNRMWLDKVTVVKK